MFLSHNSFIPEDVVSEIMRRTDSPLLTFENVYQFLYDWVEDLYDQCTTIDECDPMNELLFGDLDFLNFNSIKVLPVYWKTVIVDGPEDVKHFVGFPLIIIEVL